VAKRLYHRDVRRVVKRHVRDVSRTEVVKAYRNSGLNNLYGQFLDGRYRALPMRVWELVLEYSQVDKKQYRSEHYDCDNFAMALCGQVPTLFDVNGVGFVVDFSGGHAYNAILVSESRGHLEVVGVEPQNDRWGVAKTGARMYSARNSYTIFG
jgi:hypothetical protein